MKKKIRTILIIIASVILYLILAEHFNIYLKCPIRFFLHLYCPGCGSTRMLNSLLHGNIYQAFRYNPLLFIFIPIYILYLIINFVATKKGKVNLLKKLESKLWYFLIVLFIAYGVLRNIPIFAFLKPTLIK